MEKALLAKVNSQVKKYQDEHSGNLPLYIILSMDEGDRLMEEIREKEGHADQVPVTSWKGIQIVRHEMVQPGDLRLSDELPETGS